MNEPPLRTASSASVRDHYGHHGYYDPTGRPPTIAELAELARAPDRGDGTDWEEGGGGRDLKHWLRLAQKLRNDAKSLAEKGRTADAFVQYARSATIVLERLPTHPDYQKVLTQQQRQNLGLNGQDILDSLSKLKPTLVDMHDRWVQEHGGGSGSMEHSPAAPTPEQPYAHESPHFPIQDDYYTPPPAPAPPPPDDAVIPTHWNPEDEGLPPDFAQRMNNMHIHPNAHGHQHHQSHHQASYDPERGRWTHFHDDREREHSRPRNNSSARRRAGTPGEPQVGRARADSNSRRMDERRRQEQDGILRRQRESDAAAHAARSSLSMGANGPVSVPSRARSPPPLANMPVSFAPRSYGHLGVDMEPPHRRRTPVGGGPGGWEGGAESYGAASAAPPHRRGLAPAATMPDLGGWGHDIDPPTRRGTPGARPSPDHYGRPLGNATTMPVPLSSSFPHYTPDPGLAILPLENPNAHLSSEEDTDPESIEGDHVFPGSSAIAIPQPRHHTHGHGPGHAHSNSGGSSRGRRPSYPPPMTTTSPAPHAFPIRYPSLMSLHQRSQGYKPSVLSMFQPEASDLAPPLVPDPSFGMVYTHTPPQPEFGTPQSYRTVGDRVIPSPPEDIRAQWPGPGSYGSSGGGSTAAGSNSPGSGPLDGLRTVALPHECLTKFISIAALNTSRNLETCGLLLGKARGSKYVVTTLLVPKQRATADTCAMEEEELVMEFTEGRGLITLGWIHTHPTQSCFMSSLDLHTHAGFQRMLPESFAVVCAPAHTPNFGIFRMTDPPGLNIVLDCTAKEAFHPHPNAPIYTDADKGHVVMKDMSLEIVDLR